MKFLPFFFAIVLLSGLISCKKDHTCVCGQNVNGVSFTIRNTPKKAKAECDQMEEDFKVNCRLE